MPLNLHIHSKRAEIKEIYPIEFNQEHIAWKNFHDFVSSNPRDKDREHKSGTDWFWDLSEELEAYNAILHIEKYGTLNSKSYGTSNYEYVVSFKSEADITYFLLRFS